MKTKIFIIAFLIVSLLGAFALTGRAQSCTMTITSSRIVSMDSISSPLKFKELIADETTITYSKTVAKIVTYSEAVFKEISLKFGEQFKAIHIYYKKDRHGPYKEYQITISTELANNIKEWAKGKL